LSFGVKVGASSAPSGQEEWMIVIRGCRSDKSGLTPGYFLTAFQADNGVGGGDGVIGSGDRVWDGISSKLAGKSQIVVLNVEISELEGWSSEVER
jgi:hypothetical protein